MKAAVVEEPGKLVVKEVEDPQINQDEVLLDVISASICNATDNHILHGEFEGYHDFYPQILGHEVHGEVSKVGEEVTELKRGDRIVLYTGRGAFCEQVKINPKEELYAKVPDSIPHRTASLCEMMHGAYLGMVYPAQIKETDDVLLIGQGPMGLTATGMASLRAGTVTTVDLYQPRLETSSAMGSDYTYNRSKASAEEIVAKIKEKTNGVDLVFMCIAEDRSEDLSAYDMGVKALRRNGRMTGLVVAVKNIGENHKMNPQALIQKNIKFKHSLENVYQQEGARQEVFQHGVDVVGSGKVDLGQLATHEVTLDAEELERALDLCANELNEVLKVVVWPE